MRWRVSRRGKTLLHSSRKPPRPFLACAGRPIDGRRATRFKIRAIPRITRLGPHRRRTRSTNPFPRSRLRRARHLLDVYNPLSLWSVLIHPCVSFPLCAAWIRKSAPDHNPFGTPAAAGTRAARPPATAPPKLGSSRVKNAAGGDPFAPAPALHLTPAAASATDANPFATPASSEGGSAASFADFSHHNEDLGETGGASSSSEEEGGGWV